MFDINIPQISVSFVPYLFLFLNHLPSIYLSLLRLIIFLNLEGPRSSGAFLTKHFQTLFCTLLTETLDASGALPNVNT